MANSKRKCAYCKERKPVETMFTSRLQSFCNKDHYIEYQVASKDKLVKKGEKIQRKDLAERKKALKPVKWWQDMLQKLVNQYVVHVRDKEMPCCTCGASSPSIKYDAGHYRTRKAAPELRYELTNIHVQCSVNCNQYGSGMRSEYREFIKRNYGDDHLTWLDGKHKSLKEAFPHWSDYEAEIKRYRNLLRENGVKPCT
ncbi:NinG protein [Vibrio phage 1.029.O._10N.261.55.A7]|nr:NinG protein [Vibrio phage 1.029.O._10N.261.55.A7]